MKRMLLLSSVFVGALIAAACLRRAPSPPSAQGTAPGAHPVRPTANNRGAELDRGPKSEGSRPSADGPPPQRSETARVQELERIIEALRPLAEKLGPPQPGDWLQYHKEPGQTFQEYLASDPQTPTAARRTVYIQPLGTFTAGQRRVVTSTAEFMGLFYNLPVEMKEDLPLSLIPARARRFRWGYDQVLSTYVLDEVLKPRLPEDAAACIAFTASDLWPGEDWNFVFGQASLRDRVGVWSIRRFGDPDAGDDAVRLCLLRTLKTGVHELGHMFGLAHCIAWPCVMNGSNNLGESDRRPLHLCPQCLAKVLWATAGDPLAHYRRLAHFCRSHGLDAEADFCERSLKQVEGIGGVAGPQSP